MNKLPAFYIYFLSMNNFYISVFLFLLFCVFFLYKTFNFKHRKKTNLKSLIFFYFMDHALVNFYVDVVIGLITLKILIFF